MEQELKCMKLLSLKEMALRTLVTHSFTGTDILPTPSEVKMFCFYTETFQDECREWAEGIVKKRLLKLELPSTLLKLANDLVRPIALNLTKGLLLHSYGETSSFNRQLIGRTKLCWTSAGKVDYYKTAENFVHDDSNDVASRFEIACAFCWEESIRHLWTKLPEMKKRYYLDRYCTFGHLQWLWAHILSGDLSSKKHMLKKHGMTSFNQWGFEYSAVYPTSFGAFGTKYFFEKLTLAEKEASLMRTAHKLLPECDYDEKAAEVLHYLLTMMTPEERRKTVEMRPISVLTLFLFWPLQDLFMENTSIVWTFLPPDAYGCLLQKMSKKFRLTNYYSPKLFREFFIQSPPELKKRFANKGCDFEFTIPARNFLSWFLVYEDSESIEITFKNLDEEDRANIIFDKDVQRLFSESIVKGKLHMVKVCLQEATLSEEDKKRWEESFMDSYAAEIMKSNPEFKGFFSCFDEAKKEERGQKKAKAR